MINNANCSTFAEPNRRIDPAVVDGQDRPAVAVRDQAGDPVEVDEPKPATRGPRGGRGKSSPDRTTLRQNLRRRRWQQPGARTRPPAD